MERIDNLKIIDETLESLKKKITISGLDLHSALVVSEIEVANEMGISQEDMDDYADLIRPVIVKTIKRLFFKENE